MFAPIPVPKPAWQSIEDQKKVRAVIADCQLEVVDKQDVTSIAGDGNKNGLLLFIGEEVYKEEMVGSKEDGLFTAIIRRGPDVLTKKYRRWKEGNIVKENQMLAMIDPSIALTDCLMKRAKINAAQADWCASGRNPERL